MNQSLLLLKKTSLLNKYPVNPKSSWLCPTLKNPLSITSACTTYSTNAEPCTLFIMMKRHDDCFILSIPC